MKEPRVLIISGCKYPNGDAGSVRIHSLAKLFALCGMKIDVIGKGYSTDQDGEVDDVVTYFSFRDDSKSCIAKLVNYFGYKRKLKSFLNIKGSTYTHFVIVDIPFDALNLAIQYAKDNNIVLIHDSLEWYSPSEFRLGCLDYRYIHRDLLNKHMINRDFMIIAISRYLQNYFYNKGCKTIRIPAILEPCEGCLTKSFGSKTIITYAGLPEKKDKLKDIVEAFISLPVEIKASMELRIIGVSFDKFQRMYKQLSLRDQSNLECIKFYGRIARNEVLELLRETHFTILYRDANERYAKAGFPTKVPESLSQCIPVITNISSDLGEYLVHGENSIIINQCNNSIREAFTYVSNLSNNAYGHMRRNAKKTFDTYFDYRVYKKSVSRLIRTNESDEREDS